MSQYVLAATSGKDDPCFIVDVLEDKSIQIAYCPKHDAEFSGLEVRIPQFYQFGTLAELFYALLYEENLFPGEITKCGKIKYMIQQVYFNHLLPPEESLVILQSYLHCGEPSLSFTVRRKYDTVSTTLFEQYLKKASKNPCPDEELPEFSNYQAMLKACKRYGLHVPMHTYLEFDSGDDLISWVLQTVVDSGKTVRKCECCGRFYIPARSERQYCSQRCRNKLQSSSRSCGCVEAEKLYQKILQSITRKRKSGCSYIYGHYSDAFQGSFDPLELFAKVPVTQENQLYLRRFREEDFDAIWGMFMELKKTRYRVFSDASRARKIEKLSEAEYENAKQEYLTWLGNIFTQMKSFQKTGATKLTSQMKPSRRPPIS